MLRINLDQLAEEGYKFNYDRKNGYVEFHPAGLGDTALRDNIVDIGKRMGFNDSEVDQLLSAAYRIQVMSVLRRCSGW